MILKGGVVLKNKHDGVVGIGVTWVGDHGGLRCAYPPYNFTHIHQRKAIITIRVGWVSEALPTVIITTHHCHKIR